MPEVRSTDQAGDLTSAPEYVRPRPRELNRPDSRAGPEQRERQSPPPLAIRPISRDRNARREPARLLPLRIRPSRGSNLVSSSDITKDMRPRATLLKYLASERRKSAVPCVEKAAPSLRGVGTETGSLPKKRCADKYIAAFLRRAEIRFILQSPLHPSPETSPPLFQANNSNRTRRSRGRADAQLAFTIARRTTHRRAAINRGIVSLARYPAQLPQSCRV